MSNLKTKAEIKGNTMVQWINIHHNSSFVNLMQLPLLCEKTEAVALAQLGLMVGWLVVR